MRHPQTTKIDIWFMAVILMLWLIMLLCHGCSNTGQYHREYYPDGSLKSHDEFYSWRFLYWFGAGRANSTTPYWNINGENVYSRPDPNAIEAVVEGVVAGLKSVP